ncbi:MAG: nucleoside-diphosphate sugar epimerase/dehydratase [Pseudomonadota bacterium]
MDPDKKNNLRDRLRAFVVRFGTWLVGLPRFHKRAVLVAMDFLILAFAMWLAMSFRLAELYVPPDLTILLMLIAAPCIGVATFAWFGLYRLVTRYIGHKGTTAIAVCVTLSVLIWALAIVLSGVTGVPRSVLVLYGIFGAGMIYATRQMAALLLRGAGIPIPVPKQERPAVVIYGAGRTGVQLLEALKQTGEARPVGFLEDSSNLWGQYVSGQKIYRPEKLAKLIERERVQEVILAMPEAQRRERKAILNWLQSFPVRVKLLPAIEDFAAGRVTVSDLRAVDVDDLLGRDPVPPDTSLLTVNITGKSVMVTGAGGSIGSELVRQVLRQKPDQLVLFEQSEAALYEIESEIRENLADADSEQPKVHAVLGSVLDERRVLEILRRHQVETIYHAAAYKHVPIVEDNPMMGLTNNSFGTKSIAAMAKRAGVERMVLISTDKAVRPTNIMGASKRLAELVLQAEASDPSSSTVFTMVRFGNVLDSSGSVVRKFRRQIEAGGPVTVTHPKIIRYFMSIPEAAELVLQAGAMAQGGEVFVLEMGEPVRIADLARSMVRLMGRDVRDANNPEGDVEIEFVGLRPGEKLFEELQLGEDTTATQHPRIMRQDEPFIERDELEKELLGLKTAMDAYDTQEVRRILCDLVEGYQPREDTFKDAAADVDWLDGPHTIH